jgi:Big-like domain-containing protein
MTAPVLRLVTLCAALMCIVSCAQVGTPSGGLVDKIPPRVVNTVPRDSSVNMSDTRVIHVRFSERINMGTIENALFISPYPDPYPELSWSSGDRLLSIEMQNSLDTARTYVITIGTAAKDQHGVSMARAHTFAFATGSELDRCRIRGTIKLGLKAGFGPATGLTVGLYPLNGDTVDPATKYAMYETQTGNMGDFAFAYLSPGTYRLVAWQDRTRDFLAGEDERFAVPSRDLSLRIPAHGDTTAQSLPPMQVGSVDVSPPDLMGIQAVDREHIQLRFTEAVLVDSLTVSITRPESLKAHTIQPPKPIQTVTIRTGQQNSRTNYSVDVHAMDASGNKAQWAADTTSFLSSTRTDSSGPKITSVVVPDPAHPRMKHEIEMWFDDILAETNLDSLVVWQDSLRVEGTWVRLAPNALTFRPISDLTVGKRNWHIPLTSLRDIAGNPATDTVRVVVERLSADELGTLTGTIRDQDTVATGKIIAKLISLGTNHTYKDRLSIVDSTGACVFASVPATKCIVFAWRDTDRDEQWSPGRISPFKPSERWVISDTMQIRARWTLPAIRLVLPQ